MADLPGPEPDGDPSALLRRACTLAATDFAQSAAWLRTRLSDQAAPEIMTFIGQLLSVSDPAPVACTIYLLAAARSADLAAAAGWHALGLGCDDDQVIIALADVLPAQTDPQKTATALMQERASDRRSTAFLIKLADHYWSSGQAFLAEDVLRDMISRGRNDLMLRLAEHWFLQQDWRSARELLQRLAPDQTIAYTTYLLARCAVVPAGGRGHPRYGRVDKAARARAAIRGVAPKRLGLAGRGSGRRGKLLPRP